MVLSHRTATKTNDVIIKKKKKIRWQEIFRFFLFSFFYFILSNKFVSGIRWIFINPALSNCILAFHIHTYIYIYFSFGTTKNFAPGARNGFYPWLSALHGHSGWPNDLKRQFSHDRRHQRPRESNDGRIIVGPPRLSRIRANYRAGRFPTIVSPCASQEFAHGRRTAVPADDSQKARTALSLSIIIIYSLIDVLTQTNILIKKIILKNVSVPTRIPYRSNRLRSECCASFFLFVFNDFQTNFFYIHAR